ncbi:class I SAM-dependent methyltransferase [Streptomyces sp. NPDC001351]|uniref:class I SAM-dependent methyltransferase n=1 Tax=Streptomyces sp. NPDC001351 TaxID=3364564 RepID=UPI0036A98D5B
MNAGPVATLDEIRTYFNGKADAYDDVDAQPYWVLSDELLWSALSEFVLPRLPEAEGFRFLDAGGGTGRWSHRIATARPDSSGLLYDLTPAMFGHAREKAERHGYADRLVCQEGDLGQVGENLAGERFDLVFNFHNVLGFVDSPADVITQLSGLLKPGGLLVSFVPSRWHAAWFNLALGQTGEAERNLAGRGRFTETMPDMHLFTPEQLRTMHEVAGLQVDLISGFPVLLYPGYQETQLHGSTRSLADLLGEPSAFERILTMERGLLGMSDTVGRGNNLFVVASRPSN